MIKIMVYFEGNYLIGKHFLMQVSQNDVFINKKKVI